MADASPQAGPSGAGKNLFGSKRPSPEPAFAGRAAEDITRLASRLKISEERYSDIRKKLLLIEQNMLSHHKKAMSEIRVLHSEITDINQKINEIQDRILLVIKELKLTAKKEDVDVMKRYVELWNPMRFVTRETVESVVRDVVSQILAGKKPESKQKLPKSL